MNPVSIKDVGKIPDFSQLKSNIDFFKKRDFGMRLKERRAYFKAFSKRSRELFSDLEKELEEVFL